MYFLRRAHDLYKNRPQKELSPSFWDAEGKMIPGSQQFDAIMSGIQHPLGATFARPIVHVLINFSGRLLYTTGHVKEAVTVFLALLKSSALSTSISAIAVANEDESRTDEVYLEDFRIAFEVRNWVL